MMCQKCNQKPGTETWCAEGVMAFVHGMSQQWCKWCVNDEQLAFARKVAATIPELERRHAELSTSR